jgi:choloylglycine hydrolase
MKPRLLIFAILALLLIDIRPARPCTAFRLQRAGVVVMGKSYDWGTADGIAVLNARGVKKQAFVTQPGLTPLAWTSQYGSVTFNQYGRELPLGGMNDQGLAIEILWLTETRYPTPQARVPSTNELQWIQHHLDTARTVAEVVATARTMQVVKIYAAVHYLACDATGACATFEHLEGKLVIHHGATLPLPVLTNDAYADSLLHARRHRGLGGTTALPSGDGSLPRFTRAAAAVQAFTGTGAEAAAWRLLDDVRAGSYSKWQIVYDLKARTAAFRPAGSTRVTRVALAGRDLSCRRPVQVLDLMGTVAPKLHGVLGPYDPAINERLVRLTTARLGGGGVPAPLVAAMARLPEAATRCTLTR